MLMKWQVWIDSILKGYSPFESLFNRILLKSLLFLFKMFELRLHLRDEYLVNDYEEVRDPLLIGFLYLLVVLLGNIDLILWII